VLTASFGILLLGLVNVGIFSAAHAMVGWVGAYSFFVAVYLIAMGRFSYEKNTPNWLGWSRKRFDMRKFLR
jgi:hypothetical protein